MNLNTTSYNPTISHMWCVLTKWVVSQINWVSQTIGKYSDSAIFATQSVLAHNYPLLGATCCVRWLSWINPAFNHCCSLLSLTNSLPIFSVFKDGLSNPAVATMTEVSISTSDLPSCFGWLIWQFWRRNYIRWLLSTFETMPILANLAKNWQWEYWSILGCPWW